MHLDVLHSEEFIWTLHCVALVGEVLGSREPTVIMSTPQHQEGTYDVLLASRTPPVKLLPPSAVAISVNLRST